MSPAPTVTVVMTTYNGARFIGEAIESVLGQTFEDFELLVIDDCSRDDTVRVIQGYDDPRLRLIRNARNLGISRTRNLGLTEAKGKYLAAHDHDDISRPRRLERQVACLEADPEVVMVAAGGETFEDDRILAEAEVARPPHVLRWKLLVCCPFIHSSVCYRRSTLNEHSLSYRQEFHLAEDYDLFLRLAKVGKLVELDEPLIRYRLHGNNNFLTRNAEMVRNGRTMLFEEYRALLGPDVSEQDFDALWRTAVEARTADGRKDLLRVGRFLSRLVEGHITGHRLGDREADDVRRDASALWWRIVARTAKEHGSALLSAFGKEASLSAVAPSPADLWKTRLLATLGPGIVGAGRRLRDYARA